MCSRDVVHVPLNFGAEHVSVSPCGRFVLATGLSGGETLAVFRLLDGESPVPPSSSSSSSSAAEARINGQPIRGGGVVGEDDEDYGEPPAADDPSVAGYERPRFVAVLRGKEDRGAHNACFAPPAPGRSGYRVLGGLLNNKVGIWHLDADAGLDADASSKKADAPAVERGADEELTGFKDDVNSVAVVGRAWEEEAVAAAAGGGGGASAAAAAGGGSAAESERGPTMIVCGSDDRTVKVFDLDTKERKWESSTAHSSFVMVVSSTRDGRFTLSGSLDNHLTVCDSETGAVTATYTTRGTVSSIWCSADDRMVVVNGKGGKWTQFHLSSDGVLSLLRSGVDDGVDELPRGICTAWLPSGCVVMSVRGQASLALFDGAAFASDDVQAAKEAPIKLVDPPITHKLFSTRFRHDTEKIDEFCFDPHFRFVAAVRGTTLAIGPADHYTGIGGRKVKAARG